VTRHETKKSAKQVFLLSTDRIVFNSKDPKVTAKMLSSKLHISTRNISGIVQKLRKTKKLNELVPQEQEHVI
jgi:hypothetical protein